MEKMKEMKLEYDNTPIPDELEFIVRKTIQSEEKKMKRTNSVKKVIATAAALAVVFTGTVNISPKAAYALSDVPVVGKIVQLVTFKNFVHEDADFQAEVKIPEVKNLGDDTLENSLNLKYLEEGHKLYQDFQKQMGDMKEINAANLSVSSDYEIKNDNEKLLVIKRSTTEVQASGYQTASYDTIDKVNKVILTLPSLFKDDQYINLISENIKTQMRAQMKENPEKTYFIDDKAAPETGFEKIAKDQSFYINKDGKLVIAFNEGDVAPNSMGLVEFVIPTDVVASNLVSSAYIN